MRAALLGSFLLFLAASDSYASKIICIEYHICPDQLSVETESTQSAYDEAYSAVRKYTTYRITRNPTIRFVDQGDLMAIYINTLEFNTEWRDYFLYTLKQRKIVKEYKVHKHRKIIIESVYDANTNTIFFPNTWNQNNIRDRGLLAHELTHVAQQQSFVSPECQASFEEVALTVAYGFYLDTEYFKKAANKYSTNSEHVLRLEYKYQIGWISVCIDMEPAAMMLF